LNTDDFDASYIDQTSDILQRYKPDIVFNAVAYLGIDPCENNPALAVKLNCLHPGVLAELSNKLNFVLVHVSTDAVFNDEKRDVYVESDLPNPVNHYGMTKYAGDRFVEAVSMGYYILRIPVLFGPSGTTGQFVEKMLDRMRESSDSIRVSNDIISSPTYSFDVAKVALELIDQNQPFGLYHVANQGVASLYDLMSEIASELKLKGGIEKASFHDFPFVGKKNTYTPLASEKHDSLRPWKEAVSDYCRKLETIECVSNLK